jgi:acetyltransferase
MSAVAVSSSETGLIGPAGATRAVIDESAGLTGCPSGRLTLADGRTVEVQPLSSADAPAERAFVAALSPGARYRRFHFGLNEPSDAMLEDLVRIDCRTRVAVVARDGADRGARPAIVADARYIRLDDGGSAEFAVAVADSWQGVGLGSLLLEQIARHARAQGLRRLVGDVLAENAPMIALVERVGGRLMAHPEDGRMLRAQIPL